MRSSLHAVALTVAVDLAVVTVHERQLAVLRRRDARVGRPAFLPWTWPATHETLHAAARRLARVTLGRTLGQHVRLEQVSAVRDARPHPGGAALSIGYLAVAPSGALLRDAYAAWQPLARLGALIGRHRAVAEAAVALLRRRAEEAPVVFDLLPPTFTLTELQTIYELLAERRLHKASFRRALETAALVEATEEWRREARGRPAQLYRRALNAVGRAPRGMRLDAWRGKERA